MPVRRRRSHNKAVQEREERIFDKGDAQKVFEAVNVKDGVTKSFTMEKARIYKPPPWQARWQEHKNLSCNLVLRILS